MRKLFIAVTIMASVPFSLDLTQKNVRLSLDSAEARIGRPLTPFSVAGVHRRAYRAAAVYGAIGASIATSYGYAAASSYSPQQSSRGYYAFAAATGSLERAQLPAIRRPAYPMFDVYVNGRFVGSDPDPAIRSRLRADPPGSQWNN